MKHHELFNADNAKIVAQEAGLTDRTHSSEVFQAGYVIAMDEANLEIEKRMKCEKSFAGHHIVIDKNKGKYECLSCGLPLLIIASRCPSPS